MNTSNSELLFYQTDKKLNLMDHTQGIRICTNSEPDGQENNPWVAIKAEEETE